jgi:hypothetical protein
MARKRAFTAEPGALGVQTGETIGQRWRTGRETTFDWEQLSVLGLIVALIVGGYLRLRIVLGSDFPIHDGGLFYRMVEEIRASGFALPVFTSYNAAGIPFAYPPFAFYLTASLSSVTGWPLMTFFRFLPVTFSLLTIVAAFLFTRAVLASGRRAAFAVVAFALLPRSFEWAIMGGGLTRSVGFFFAVLTLLCVYRMYQEPRWKWVAAAIACAGLTILSHPNSTIMMIYGSAVLWLFFGRTRRGFVQSLGVAAGALLLSAPWWASVLLRHGPAPLLAASSTGFNNWYSWVPLLTFTFSVEQLDVIAVLALIGAVACIVDRNWIFPVFLATAFLVDPRGAMAAYSTLFLAMLAAIGLDRVILPGCDPGVTADGARAPVQRLLQQALVLVFFVHGIISTYLFPSTSDAHFFVAAPEERQTMQWVEANTSPDSRFLVISSLNAVQDAVSEWFPVLAGRTSVATWQGFEWVPGQFYHRFLRFEQAQKCATRDAACLETWLHEEHVPVSHIYLSKTGTEPLLRSLREAPDRYRQIYDGPGAAIFEYR